MSENELNELVTELMVENASLEVALLAAMRCLLASSPEATYVLKESYPALLAGLSGESANKVRAGAERQIVKWLPTDQV